MGLICLSLRLFQLCNHDVSLQYHGEFLGAWASVKIRPKKIIALYFVEWASPGWVIWFILYIIFIANICNCFARRKSVLYISESTSFTIVLFWPRIIILYIYCVITAVQNVRIPLFPIGNFASNQIHNKFRNVMATANEFVSGDDFEAILFLSQTQSNCVSS